MAKHSKRNRRRMHQSGLGGGFSLAHRLPKVSRGRVQVAELSPIAEERLKIVRYAQKRGVAAAMEAFGVSRATVYRWLARYDPRNLRTLESRSRRPKRTRRRQWTAVQEAAVLRLRLQFPRYGKARLAVLLAREDLILAESTIGRILASLKRRALLIEPHAVRVRHPKPARPYATRVPKDKRIPTTPGELVQLDTVHLRPLPGVERRQFTAVDVVSRCAVVGVRSRATAGTAAAFLDELVARMPFPVQAIQVDGGSEFMADFEQACQAREIALYVLPPRSPKLNGCVERLNGTTRREFWECYGGDLDLLSLQAALRAWEVGYNTERPHQSLDYLTPMAHLATLLVSHVSN
jgi:putative transposase